MVAAIDPKEAKQWFGANPPDLTVIARSRAAVGQGSGADYLYTYLRTYYPDATKETGWNNLAFPNVGMPHALWQLQGDRKPLYDVTQEHGQEVQVFKGWEQLSPGTMTPLQYDQAMGDLVNYLQWMGEPSQNSRKRIGVWRAPFPGLADRFHLALERSVLERHQVTRNSSRPVRRSTGLAFSEWDRQDAPPTLFGFEAGPDFGLACVRNQVLNI